MNSKNRKKIIGEIEKLMRGIEEINKKGLDGRFVVVGVGYEVIGVKLGSIMVRLDGLCVLQYTMGERISITKILGKRVSLREVLKKLKNIMDKLYDQSIKEHLVDVERAEKLKAKKEKEARKQKRIKEIEDLNLKGIKRGGGFKSLGEILGMIELMGLVEAYETLEDEGEDMALILECLKAKRKK